MSQSFFFCHPRGEGWFFPYLPFFNYFINFMALEHITKRFGYLLVEEGGKILWCSSYITSVMQFLHHKPLLKEQEKWINPYPPYLHVLKFEFRAKMITERRSELWKQSHAGYYRLASIAGSARISQYIRNRFTDRTWGATNLKYFNSFIFNIPRKKWINRRY